MRFKDRVMRFWVHDFIHNAVIHPIMAFLPIEMGDRLHEWHAKVAFGDPDDE